MLEKIRTWKRKEGLVKESVWLDEGIRLYRDLLAKQPDHSENKIELAELLVRNGTDEKLVYENLLNARELFEEVLELFPDYADALYRLGHIHYETNDYERCIDYFTKAISQPLSDIRMFRACSTMAKAYFCLGDDREAYRYLEKSKEIDKENNFSSEIKEVEALITQKGYLRRIVHYPDGVSMCVNRDDAESVKDNYQSDEGTLDLSHLRPTFSGPRDATTLERREAEILSCLIERKRFITKEELIQYVWSENNGPAPDTIKSYISKINRKLEPCLKEGNKRAIISSRGQGYKWDSIDTIIMKIL